MRNWNYVSFFGSRLFGLKRYLVFFIFLTSKWSLRRKLVIKLEKTRKEVMEGRFKGSARFFYCNCLKILKIFR